ncbi:hypothetical protein Ccrd_022111 [Cynara cardunculus var. scolymus]|uniref:CSC1/OSCA1-like N-terminal transmembrane domain-containing protein n=1 Tax=Cynara cardunculus var. scolymus TaxID=59895 RepID=A0A103XZA7_CYNCS|nr:hypothetical protein Ccrd_022111 [Cynara cardunculus var. scolymus]
MDIPALLTSAGMNIGISVGMFSLYSILRKQPLNVKVYFGQRVSQGRTRNETLCFERFVPSASWILKAWEATEEDIFASGGMERVIDSNAMDLLTIGNVREGSSWLWAHCFTLFPARPSNFTVLVRGVPWCAVESYNESVGKFFGNYYASSYIAHQIVYRSGAVQTILLLQLSHAANQMLTGVGFVVKDRTHSKRLPVNQKLRQKIIELKMN